MESNDKELYLGLDVGDASVGWALTNEDYDLVRIKGQNAWGARLFDAAEDCKERRTYRSSRRRMQRRRYRIKLLQELFNDEVVKKDESFFMRLNESSYVLEDKKYSAWTLFNNQEEEKAYFKKYPTIWHLRQDLVKNSNSEAYNDIRLVYLAIHHIIKYRGNFLQEGQTYNFSSINDDTLLFLNSSINSCLNFFGIDDELEVFDVKEKDELIKVILDQSIKFKDKDLLLKKYIHTINKDLIDCLSKLMTGRKYNFKKLLDSDKNIDIEFKSMDDATLESNLVLLEDLEEVVRGCKEIYDFSVLYNLLKGKKFLCDSMVDIYEQHRKSLKFFKTNIKKADSILNNGFINYKAFFVNKKDTICKYESYAKSSGSQPAYLAFEKDLIGLITKYKEAGITLFDDVIDSSSKTLHLKKEYSLETISLNSTSVIPHQLHLTELEIILDNLTKHYQSFDNEKINRISQIFKFKIPYFVGPLTDNKEMSKYQNLVKKEGKEKEHIYPWNFDEIVDIEKTRTKFMGQRLNSCLFLIGEDVLPKSSLLYEEYSFLDKINALRVNGRLIDLNERNAIVKEAKKKQYLTRNDLIKILDKGNNDEIVLTGIDLEGDKLKVGLLSYNYFSKKGFDVDNNHEVIEDIIKVLTIYKDDTRPAFDVLKNKYPDIDVKLLSSVLGFKTTGFGSFSKALLDDKIYYTDDNGVVSTTIQLMRDNVLTFEQVRYKYDLNDRINEFNSLKENTKDLIEEEMEFIPPKIRRSVNQAIKIVDELNDLLKSKKQKINKIFIEVTREDEKIKQRTVSRYEQVKDFLTDVKKQKEIFASDIDQLSNQLELYKEKINGQALYLYFMQLGYDAYTGEKITSIEDVIQGKYDIDHIVPQSIMKDDSLDNKVLVNKISNQKVKGNLYPIPEVIRTNPKVLKLWYFLHHKFGKGKLSLMSDKKYNALIRSTHLTEDELNGFVARQITTLNYANREIVKILQLKYPYLKNNIIFSKAGFVSEYRKIDKIYKIRALNNTHHAVDAYLNVVVGNVIYKTFTNFKARMAIFKKILGFENEETENKPTLNFMRVFTHPWVDYWNKEKREKVHAICYRHDMLLTRKSFVDYGRLYKQTIFKKGEKSNLIPIHTNGPLANTQKYGGYSALNICEFAYISYKIKDKEFKGLVAVPLIDLVNSNKGEDLSDLLFTRYQLKELKVIKLIKNNSLVEINGTRFLFTGGSIGDPRFSMNIFEPLFIDESEIKNLSILYKYYEILNTDSNINSQEIVVNKEGRTLLVTRDINNNLFNILLDAVEKGRFGYLKNEKVFKDLILSKSCFYNLSLQSQAIIIINMIKLYNSTFRDSDLSLLNNENASFSSVIQYRYSPRKLEADSVTLIDQSITGLRYKKIKL